MTPATTGLADAAAHDQEVDDPPVVHVHMVPVVQTGAKDDHGTTVGLFGIECKLAGNRDDLVARHARDLLGPGRRIGLVVVIGRRAACVLEPTVEAVIGDEQIEHGRDERVAFGKLHLPGRNGTQQHAVVVRSLEVVVLAIAEIGKADRGDLVMVPIHDEGHVEFDILALAVLVLEIPLALLAPAKADGAIRDDDLLGLAVDGDRLPVGVVGLAESALEVGRAQQLLGDVMSVLLHQADQHRHVGVAAAVVLEILCLPVEVELAQHDVPQRHGQRSISALLGMQPHVGELRGLRIVRRHDDRLGALVADLGIEMSVRRPRLRNVGSPEHQEAGIVPVGRFRNIRLLAPGHRGSRRQIAVPVIERHADAAEQRQIARSRGVGDHRHGRDRREPDDPVRSPFAGGVGIGRGDDLVDLVPCRADESAMATNLDVVTTLRRIFLDRGPGTDGRLHHPFLAPLPDQPSAHQGILHPVGRIHVPAVAGTTRTAARLVIGQVRSGARVVGLLGFPGDDAALDVDLPGAGARAVHAMGGSDDLVVLPALAIGVFPVAVFIGRNAVALGKGSGVLARQEIEAVQKV